MSMTPERLAELRKMSHAGGVVYQLCDAVEALQAVLAEERRKTFAAVTDYSKRLADEQTLHRETERQLAEERAKLVNDSIVAQRDSLRDELAEERAWSSAQREAYVWWKNRAEQAEDIANLAMRVGLEMLHGSFIDGEWVCLAQEERDAAIQRAEKVERERDRYLADANEYALQIHDLRAKLAACVAALENPLEHNPAVRAARALAAAKSDVGEISK